MPSICITPFPDTNSGFSIWNGSEWLGLGGERKDGTAFCVIQWTNEHRFGLGFQIETKTGQVRHEFQSKQAMLDQINKWKDEFKAAPLTEEQFLIDPNNHE